MKQQVEINNEKMFESEMPNEETIKAIKAAREGVDLIACEGVEDMFKKLEYSEKIILKGKNSI